MLGKLIETSEILQKRRDLFNKIRGGVGEAKDF